MKVTLKGQGSAEVWVSGQGVVSVPSPNPSLLLFHHLVSPYKCQQASFYNSFSICWLEVLHTYVSLEITVVMMPRKLHKQLLLEANEDSSALALNFFLCCDE